jgi:hypothetical protein
MSAVGNSLPRFAARRRMPVAARADRKNLGGVVGCSTSASVEGDDEHPASSLRHSEVSSVENAVTPHVPEFRHATLEGVEVPTAMTGEESRYVFEEDRGRSVSLHKVEEGIGEAAPGVGAHASPLPCDAEILAREAAAPEVGASPVALGAERTADALVQLDDVTEVGDGGPVSGEDG